MHIHIDGIQLTSESTLCEELNYNVPSVRRITLGDNGICFLTVHVVAAQHMHTS